MRFLLRLLVTLAVAGWCQSVAASVPSTDSYVDATANGVTHIFTFTFAVTTSSSHVEVYLADAKQAVGYVVALNQNQASSPGGTVTFLANSLPNPPANGVRVRIQRMVPLTQETILSPYSPYRAKDVEKALDRLAYQTQQLDRYAKVNQAARDDAQDLALAQAQIAGGVVWQRAVATFDTSSSSTAAATDVAGLSFATASGRKYLLRAVLWVYAAALTTGHGISAKATGAPTTSTAFFTHEVPPTPVPSAPAEIRYGGFADTPVASGETSSASSGLPGRDNFHGYLVTTGAGTFRLRLITEVNASAVTVKAGSYLEWMELL